MDEKQIRSEMIDAILAAKESDDFKAMFGERCIPSPEKFIMTVAKLLSGSV